MNSYENAEPGFTGAPHVALTTTAAAPIAHAILFAAERISALITRVRG